MVEAARIPLSLYIHWPWCVRKCPYCDFASRARPAASQEERYIAAVLRSLEAEAAGFGTARAIGTIYIGGGTPSLISPAGISRLLAGVRGIFPVSEGAEVSMEANPGTVTRESLGGFREAGVNRLSIGVQSFDDGCLSMLGRIHTSGEAAAAARAAAEVFDNFNLDVMFALPGQSREMLEADLAAATALSPSHLSVYELTIEDGTAFAKRPPRGLPDDDEKAAMGDIVVERLRRAGFRRYEVSGYARPGRECRHNLNYWTYGDYLAAGSGAHGKITSGGRVIRFSQLEDPSRYMEAAEAGAAFGASRDVGRGELVFEFMLDALRLRDGFPLTLFEERTGLAASLIEPTLESARVLGLVALEGGAVRSTDKGFDFLSDLQAMFLP